MMMGVDDFAVGALAKRQPGREQTGGRESGCARQKMPPRSMALAATIGAVPVRKYARPHDGAFSLILLLPSGRRCGRGRLLAPRLRRVLGRCKEGAAFTFSPGGRGRPPVTERRMRELLRTTLRLSPSPANQARKASASSRMPPLEADSRNGARPYSDRAWDSGRDTTICYQRR